MRHSPAVPVVPVRPTTFAVGDHTLVVAMADRRWTVSVDSRLLDGSFETGADAWHAGVRDAFRLDALRGG